MLIFFQSSTFKNHIPFTDPLYHYIDPVCICSYNILSSSFTIIDIFQETTNSKWLAGNLTLLFLIFPEI